MVAEMTRRLRLRVRGSVQGVGYRPLVYRAAKELRLGGWVKNDPGGVLLEVEGIPSDLETFVQRVTAQAPAPARIESFEAAELEPLGASGFDILPSDVSGQRETTLLPDLAPCPDCLKEIFDPRNRRYAYPFTNCTHCGPRFTIIRGVPYDRKNTTMSRFTMCPRCQAEYDDPENRRFHAQPNACPRCGPRLRLLDTSGRVSETDDTALDRACAAIVEGAIVAVQGVGGFQLLVDATDAEAVLRLRTRKHRWEKPLAVMVGSLDMALALARLDATEQGLLLGPEAPIVLLDRLNPSAIADPVAPNNPHLGLMLPSSPLHHLLMRKVNRPIVATSGNLSEEPICIDPDEAHHRLGKIADLFLAHDRPIERHADDSVAQVVDGCPQVLRRARGYAPLPVPVPGSHQGQTVLALGGHQKSSVALLLGGHAFVSQHIGDLDGARTRATYRKVVTDLLRLYDAHPVVVAHDLHPDYASTLVAEELASSAGPLSGVRLFPVQHHHAHLAACLADNSLVGPALGVIWDGSGLGPDGDLWGGEFLVGGMANFARVGSWLPFRLPGGDASARSPRRSALALLWHLWGAAAFERTDLPPVAATEPDELAFVARQLQNGRFAPFTSSVGRLFDAISSVLGLAQQSSFEGQAAMALEHAADAGDHGCYPLGTIPSLGIEGFRHDAAPGRGTPGTAGLRPHPDWLLDWRPILAAIIDDRDRGTPMHVMAGRFHRTLAEAASLAADQSGTDTVALSGGCFQNRLLTSLCREALERRFHRVLVHSQVPPNDGGIALGQAMIAAASLGRNDSSPLLSD